MELLETLGKLLGLLIFYTIFFLVGGTFLCFMLLVALTYGVVSLFGIKKSQESLTVEDTVQEDQNVFISSQTILYKKEEVEVEVMYAMEHDTPLILSIMGEDQDYTEVLSEAEMSRLIVTLEHIHVG